MRVHARLRPILSVIAAVAAVAATLVVVAAHDVASAEQASAPPASDPIESRVAAGALHTCVLDADGRVFCWGSNDNGQLGRGDTATIGDDEPASVLAPVHFSDATHDRAVAVAAGGEHSCAIDTAGALHCWGRNVEGQLGQGRPVAGTAVPATLDPVPLGAGRAAVAVSAGDDHTCAILDDGSLRCWGANGSGQLGYGNTTSSTTKSPADLGPVDLGPGRTAVAVSAGDGHTCAILDDGSVRCWGLNAVGQLGYGNKIPIGDDELPSAAGPVSLAAGHRAVAISAATEHTCAIMDDGSVRCWGGSFSGVLGYGDTVFLGGAELPSTHAPVDIGAGRRAVAIDTGRGSTCVVLDDGVVRCWGFNDTGRLGLGLNRSGPFGDDETPAAIPAVDVGGVAARAIVTGLDHTCAVVGQDVRCWGSGTSGQLGNAATATIGDGERPTAIGPVPLGHSLSITEGNRFTALAPSRLLDTRDGTGAPAGVLGAAGEVELQVAGRGGVPASGVSAVVLNVTVTDATGPGFVTVYPAGRERPLASNLNVERAGQTIANLVTVKLGAGGTVRLFTQSGGHLVADVAGYYTPTSYGVSAGRFTPVEPARLLDTRALGSPFAAGETRGLVVIGTGGVPAAGASAVVLNVTVTEAAGPGFVTVFPAGGGLPLASNVNYVPGQTIPNQVIVPVGAAGAVEIFSLAPSHVVVDVAGWFTDGSGPPSAAGLFVPIDPQRVLDTRTSAKPVDGSSARVDPVGTAIPAGTAVGAVVLNVTATETAAPTFVTAYPDGIALPVASNLNADRAEQTIPNHVTVQTSTAGRVSLFTQRSTHLVVDLAGWYTPQR